MAGRRMPHTEDLEIVPGTPGLLSPQSGNPGGKVHVLSKPSSWNTFETSARQLRRLAEENDLYALLDACGQPSVPVKMQELGSDNAVSLFKGSAQEEYWAVAPYLARVDVALLRWMYEQLWDSPWGVFVVAPVPLRELRDHLRRFLVVTLPDEKKWFLRYYDPRVLPVFLATCNDQEWNAFLGPVRSYGICESQTSIRWFAK
jgi:hypothetical protein